MNGCIVTVPQEIAGEGGVARREKIKDHGTCNKQEREETQTRKIQNIVT
jgi:hypothetical protein